MDSSASPSSCVPLDLDDVDLDLDLDFELNFDGYFDDTQAFKVDKDLPQRFLGCLEHGADCNWQHDDEHGHPTLTDLHQSIEFHGTAQPLEPITAGYEHGEASTSSHSARSFTPEAFWSERVLQNEPCTMYGPHSASVHASTTTIHSGNIHPVAQGFVRQVTVVQNACRTAQHTMVVHSTLQEREMFRYNRLIDTYASLVETTERTCQQTKDVLSRLEFQRVQRLQEEILEPQVGRFSHNDNVHTERFARFEDRLLTILHVGLLRQELFGSRNEDADARGILEINGSCLLEARVWQLQILRSWSVGLEAAIISAGGSIPEEE